MTRLSAFLAAALCAGTAMAEQSQIDFDRLDENASTFIKFMALFALLFIIYKVGKWLGLTD